MNDRKQAAKVEARDRARNAVAMAAHQVATAPYLLGEGVAGPGEWDRKDVLEEMNEIVESLRSPTSQTGQL